jgi:hypothetical protein
MPNPVLTLHPVKRVKDADIAVCETCGPLGDWPVVDPIFTPSKTKWHHERGTGHSVKLYRVSVDAETAE